MKTFPVHAHSVQFYHDDRYIVETVADFIAHALDEGASVIGVVTPAHREAVDNALRARGSAPAGNDRLVWLDAEETLSRLMVGDTPDAARFEEVIGTLIATVSARSGRSPYVFGEMVSLLCEANNTSGAILLEQLWNDYARRQEFTLLCGYALPVFADAEHTADFSRICDAHAHVRPTEEFTRRDPDAQLAEISRLQQRSVALEAEVQRRREREAELSDVLENAAEGIHCVDANGIIKWANARELEMLGYTADEYFGRHITEFHVDPSTIADMLARLSRRETLHDYPARLRRKDGTVREVLVTSNALFRDGRFVHTRCFTRDVTELARANRAKSQFLAVMSHELRTPLNAIGGHVELLTMGIHGPLTTEQREALERVQRSQMHLLGMINQVLNYARVETGTLRFDVQDVPMHDVLRSIEAMMLPQLNARGLVYTCETCAPEPVARADREKVQQIVLNLLGNAAKFSDPGGNVTLTCSRANGQVVLQVRDTGIGIPRGKLQSIFEPFVQVDTNYTRTRDGIGLGLAISRDLARAMAGDLTADSAEGTGSTFTLTLPAAVA